MLQKIFLAIAAVGAGATLSYAVNGIETVRGSDCVCCVGCDCEACVLDECFCADGNCCCGEGFCDCDMCHALTSSTSASSPCCESAGGCCKELDLAAVVEGTEGAECSGAQCQKACCQDKQAAAE